MYKRIVVILTISSIVALMAAPRRTARTFSWQETTGMGSQFEVATIKLTPREAKVKDHSTIIDNSRIHLGSYSLTGLVAKAFNTSVQHEVWPGGDFPTLQFTVDGVAPKTQQPASQEAMMAMLRTLLQVHLQLVADFEDRPATAFVLRKWKDGPSPATPSPSQGQGVPGDAQTIDEIINHLQLPLGPIVDKTGLEGSFRYDSTMTAQWCQQAVQRPDRAAEIGVQLSQDCLSKPSVKDVLRKYGFDLNIEKTTIHVLVIKSWRLPVDAE